MFLTFILGNQPRDAHADFEPQEIQGKICINVSHIASIQTAGRWVRERLVPDENAPAPARPTRQPQFGPERFQITPGLVHLNLRDGNQHLVQADFDALAEKLSLVADREIV